MDIIVDCRSMLCPLPLIETKKAIKSAKKGTIIKIIIDNDTSLSNLKRYLSDNGIDPKYSIKEGNHILVFTAANTQQSLSKPENHCTYEPKTNANNRIAKDYIVVLKSNTMGKGDDTLGKMLMKGFLSTICELDSLPKEVICFNSAVKLAINETATARNLEKLNELGVKITLCGTCVDFFNLKNSIKIGEISNMYYIATTMLNAEYMLEP
ncbi:MAG: sulfurtransferase-like selenium metabolism protein YedF [Bacteroidales bacterium]|nr:sulfurtransferase-like selenium metabolism protein YedF [Bacteroidales bacterium]MDD3892839.1 sulfurtransferase-like selenium metabolism protein YedF [Bacteroidales bacterium]